MNPMQSRKAFIAWVTSALASGLVGWSINKGWIPPDRQTDAILALTGIISGIWSFVGMAIGIEDAGAKVGPPTPDIQKLPPRLPTTVLLALVVGLGLLIAAPVAAQPSLPGTTATAYGTPDLSGLAKAAHGRQNDKGVNWPADFRVADVVVLVKVVDDKTGEVYWMEPLELSQKRASLHKMLFAHTRFGLPLNKWNTVNAIRTDVETKGRVALAEAAARMAAQIPGLLGRGDALIAQLVAQLFAR